MSQPFTTRCPHCGEQVKVPYTDVSRFIRRDQALIGVARRKDLKEHLEKMVRKRWPASYLHPKQQAILELAEREDISQLTLKQIAEKVGVSGRYREHYTWRYLSQLRQKGLLSEKERG